MLAQAGREGEQEQTKGHSDTSAHITTMVTILVVMIFAIIDDSLYVTASVVSTTGQRSTV
jgi:hypothetical protein